MLLRPLLLLLLAFALVLPAAAQRGPGQSSRLAERLDARVQRLDDALDLSDEQVVAVRALLTEQMEEMQGLMRAGRPDRETMVALRAAHQEALEALLTPAQVAPYRALVAQERAERPRRGRRGDGSK